MQISLSEAGKRFNREWIFRKLSYQFSSGTSYAITGPNGSGKSTLLQVIAGAVTASEGKLEYAEGLQQIDPECIFQHLSIAAPYQELIEEMTLNEFLAFHIKFKPLLDGMGAAAVMDRIGLSHAADKQIRNFSSGMKQRVKLGQAIFSSVACVLLDEPTTNLDAQGLELYRGLIENYSRERLLIISSNDRNEYAFCAEVIDVMQFKKA